MTNPASTALAALLDPRSVRLAGKPPRRTPELAVSRRPPCRIARGSSKRVDVEIRYAASPRGGPAARAVLVAAGRTPRPAAEGQLILGPGCALWTPTLQVGIPAVPKKLARDTPAAPCLIVTQGRSIARHLVAQALEADLRLSGAVCSGNDRPTGWDDIVSAARTLDSKPVVLLALHRATSIERLLRAGQLGENLGRVVLLPLGEARWATVPSDLPADGELLPRLSVAAVADAAGWTVVASAEELIRAGALIAAGLGPRRVSALRLTAQASSRDEATLLASALARAGLELSHSRGRSGQVKVVAPSPRPRRSTSAGQLAIAADGSRFTLGAAGQAPLAVGAERLSSTLAALAALSRTSCPAGRRPDPSRPPRLQVTAEEVAAVHRHLDYTTANLGEHDLRQILAAIGLPVTPGIFVRSASAAATAAKRVGLPAALRAVGASLWGDPRAVIDRDLETTSAVRDAFQQLLHRCREMHPPPVVDGVLVYPQTPRGAELGCGLLWLPEQTLMLVDGPVTAASRQRAVRCPCSLDEALDATRGVLRREADDPAVARAARFLARLAHAAELLADRMVWLRIDRLVIPQAPAKDSEVVVAGCYGVQRHHLLGLTR